MSRCVERVMYSLQVWEEIVRTEETYRGNVLKFALTRALERRLNRAEKGGDGLYWERVHTKYCIGLLSLYPAVVQAVDIVPKEVPRTVEDRERFMKCLVESVKKQSEFAASQVGNALEVVTDRDTNFKFELEAMEWSSPYTYLKMTLSRLCKYPLLLRALAVKREAGVSPPEVLHGETPTMTIAMNKIVEIVWEIHKKIQEPQMFHRFPRLLMAERALAFVIGTDAHRVRNLGGLPHLPAELRLHVARFICDFAEEQTSPYIDDGWESVRNSEHAHAECTFQLYRGRRPGRSSWGKPSAGVLIKLASGTTAYTLLIARLMDVNNYRNLIPLLEDDHDVVLHCKRESAAEAAEEAGEQCDVEEEDVLDEDEGGGKLEEENPPEGPSFGLLLASVSSAVKVASSTGSMASRREQRSSVFVIRFGKIKLRVRIPEYLCSSFHRTIN